MNHPDVYVGTTLLTLCAVVYWNTTTFPEVPAMLSQNVAPTFFPRLVLLVIAVLSVALIVHSRNSRRVPREGIARGTLVTAGVMIATVALIPRLGMLSTTSLASIVLPLTWGERRWLRIALLAIGLPASIYLIFDLGLDMRFPQGLLL